MPVDGSSPVLLDGDEWQAYFRDFKRSAFRLLVSKLELANQRVSLKLRFLG